MCGHRVLPEHHRRPHAGGELLRASLWATCLHRDSSGRRRHREMPALFFSCRARDSAGRGLTAMGEGRSAFFGPPADTRENER